MKKRLLALLLALSLAAPGFGTTPAAFAAQRGAGLPPDAKSTTAPDKDLQINFWMDEGVPYYNVVLNGTALLEDGTLGLNTTAGIPVTCAKAKQRATSRAPMTSTATTWELPPRSAWRRTDGGFCPP